MMGVINVTPDSFSDGGQFLAPEAALAQAERLLADGADLLDIGAESTRPGSRPIAEGEEWERLQPVLEALVRRNLTARVSVDTRYEATMLRAADLGVAFINNIEGLAQEPTLRKLSRYEYLGFIAMHMHGVPDSMQNHPLGARAALAAVDRFFGDAVNTLSKAGFASNRIWLDPGIGFGKTDRANVQLMARVSTWARHGYQIAIGVSRKSLLGRTLSLPDPISRDAPSKTLELGLAMAGAQMLRTHDVARLNMLIDLLDPAGSD